MHYCLSFSQSSLNYSSYNSISWQFQHLLSGLLPSLMSSLQTVLPVWLYTISFSVHPPSSSIQPMPPTSSFEMSLPILLIYSAVSPSWLSLNIICCCNPNCCSMWQDFFPSFIFSPISFSIAFLSCRHVLPPHFYPIVLYGSLYYLPSYSFKLLSNFLLIALSWVFTSALSSPSINSNTRVLQVLSFSLYPLLHKDHPSFTFFFWEHWKTWSHLSPFTPVFYLSSICSILQLCLAISGIFPNPKDN